MQVKNSSDKLIFIPYANIDNASTGVNISKKESSINIYLKNACVALISAKHYNSSCDVALVTNTDIPEPYKSLLSSNNVMIIKFPFDCFYFGKEYGWSLAFYKLCALNHIVSETQYEYVSYMDTDVYVQSSFDYIWKECDDHILLYDINHGIQVRDYNRLLNELEIFGIKKALTHYGGEFFASNRASAMEFVNKALDIYNEMVDKKFVTEIGDEFIISVVADKLKESVKNAGAYIFRFWTRSFRLVSTCYEFNPVSVLHVPDEKEDGIMKLYDKYISKSIVPSPKKVYNILHLRKQSLKVRIWKLKNSIFK